MQPAADGGSDSIDNAIPVCFECHAEIHLYNDQHPRGRKYRPDELRLHKTQWLEICAEMPERLISATSPATSGPIQSLVDELDFNATIASQFDGKRRGGIAFHLANFEDALKQGVISMLPDGVKGDITKTYTMLLEANVHQEKLRTNHWGGTTSDWGVAFKELQQSIGPRTKAIAETRQNLLDWLGHGPQDRQEANHAMDRSRG